MAREFKKTKAGILIHFENDFIEMMNDISTELGMSRAELIRRSLERDLNFVREVELPKWREQQEKLKSKYKNRVVNRSIFHSLDT